MNLKTIEKWITTRWGMWLLFFICTAALAALAQLVLIPHFIPHVTRRDCGYGLYSDDAVFFHIVARQQAADMMKYGWKAWHLFPIPHFIPLRCYPAGIASIFYYLWRPEPYTLIPFNAALHATAGCLVFFILSSFIPDRIAAFAGAALFVLNPASLEWTSQIHKDGTFILGNLLVLVSWLLISKSIKTGKWRALIYSLAAFSAGTLMIWVSRPYWIKVLVAPCAILSAVMFIYMVTAWYRSRSITGHHIVSFLLLCIMVVMQQSAPEKGISLKEAESYTEKAAGLRESELLGIKGFKSVAGMRNHVYGAVVIEGQYKGIFVPNRIEWRFNRWMPAFLESRLYSIAVCRLGAATSGGRSLIDPEVQFISVTDYLSYFPRALEVGFLSPFPSMWTTPGENAAGTMGRYILGIVTIFFYICIAFFVLGSRIYLTNRDFWLSVLYSTYGLLVFSYAYPNVGILNRMRYDFFMTIASIGFAFAIMKMRHKLQRWT